MPKYDLVNVLQLSYFYTADKKAAEIKDSDKKKFKRIDKRINGWLSNYSNESTLAVFREVFAEELKNGDAELLKIQQQLEFNYQFSKRTYQYKLIWNNFTRTRFNSFLKQFKTRDEKEKFSVQNAFADSYQQAKKDYPGFNLHTELVGYKKILNPIEFNYSPDSFLRETLYDRKYSAEFITEVLYQTINNPTNMMIHDKYFIQKDGQNIEVGLSEQERNLLKCKMLFIKEYLWHTLDKYNNDIFTQIETNGSALFTSGSIDHHTVTEIIKTGDRKGEDCYTLKIYNAGAMMYKDNEGYHNVTEYNNLTIRSVRRYLNYHNLLRFSPVESDKKGWLDSIFTDVLFNGIFGGRPDKKYFSDITPQVTGNCTVRSNIEYLRLNLKPEQLKKLEDHLENLVKFEISLRDVFKILGKMLNPINVLNYPLYAKMINKAIGNMLRDFGNLLSSVKDNIIKSLKETLAKSPPKSKTEDILKFAYFFNAENLIEQLKAEAEIARNSGDEAKVKKFEDKIKRVKLRVNGMVREKTNVVALDIIKRHLPEDHYVIKLLEQNIELSKQRKNFDMLKLRKSEAILFPHMPHVIDLLNQFKGFKNDIFDINNFVMNQNKSNFFNALLDGMQPNIAVKAESVPQFIAQIAKQKYMKANQAVMQNIIQNGRTLFSSGWNGHFTLTEIIYNNEKDNYTLKYYNAESTTAEKQGKTFAVTIYEGLDSDRVQHYLNCDAFLKNFPLEVNGNNLFEMTMEKVFKGIAPIRTKQVDTQVAGNCTARSIKEFLEHNLDNSENKAALGSIKSDMERIAKFELSLLDTIKMTFKFLKAILKDDRQEEMYADIVNKAWKNLFKKDNASKQKKSWVKASKPKTIRQSLSRGAE